MRKIFALLLCVAVLLMSSCSLVVGDINTLMRPPRPSGEMSLIQQALENDVKEYTMIFPRAGDHRSAYIMHDLNGDGIDEALVFYITKGDKSVPGMLYIHILNKTDGEWRSMDKKLIENASGVDKVEFTDLDNDGIDEALVGYSLLTGPDKQLCVYSCKGKLTEYFSQNYNEYITAPLTGEVHEDEHTPVTNLLLVKSSPTDPPVATARLFTISGGSFVENGSTAIDSQVSSYGKLHLTSWGDRPVVLVDALKGSSYMVTDVVYYSPEKRQLMAPTFNSSTLQSEQTQRTQVACRDIDNNGSVEIPLMTELPLAKAANLQPAPEDYVYLTRWIDYNITIPSEPQIVLSAVMNYADGYYLSFPDKWLEASPSTDSVDLLPVTPLVTVTRDTAKRERTFYSFDYMQNAPGRTLFSIRIFQEKDWGTSISAGYNMLLKSDTLVYGVKMGDSTDPLAITEPVIKNELFGLIQSGTAAK